MFHPRCELFRGLTERPGHSDVHGNALAQRLQDDAAVLGGGEEHLHFRRIGLGVGLKIHAASHLLKPDRQLGSTSNVPRTSTSASTASFRDRIRTPSRSAIMRSEASKQLASAAHNRSPGFGWSW